MVSPTGTQTEQGNLSQKRCDLKNVVFFFCWGYYIYVYIYIYMIVLKTHIHFLVHSFFDWHNWHADFCWFSSGWHERQHGAVQEQQGRCHRAGWALRGKGWLHSSSAGCDWWCGPAWPWCSACARRWACDCSSWSSWTTTKTGVLASDWPDLFDSNELRHFLKNMCWCTDAIKSMMDMFG